VPGALNPADALAVHGLSAEFLADKPLFAAVADEFLVFVGDAPLVAHNAGFDIAFLNAELNRAAKPPIATERVIDTLVLARRKHPGGHTSSPPKFSCASFAMLAEMAAGYAEGDSGRVSVSAI
jgi:DNA polymerase III epsilon subunit-like protein